MPKEQRSYPNRGDGLRLFALGRVPRCAVCPRYRVLADARIRGPREGMKLPSFPPTCTYELCAPLALRYRRAVGIDAVGATGSVRAASG